MIYETQFILELKSEDKNTQEKILREYLYKNIKKKRKAIQNCCRMFSIIFFNYIFSIGSTEICELSETLIMAFLNKFLIKHL